MLDTNNLLMRGKNMNEYFMGKFARNLGQNGGEFYTPRCVVELLVEMIEPFNGKVYEQKNNLIKCTYSIHCILCTVNIFCKKNMGNFWVITNEK